MFITFEGIDGSGKTTQILLLKDYLESLGCKTLFIREPGGTKFSEIIRDILLSENLEISPISELMLFEAARANLTSEVIIPALRKGFFVLCDRFYDSTTAYQGYGRQLDLAQVMVINEMATFGIEPDITFYLRLPLEESKKRSKHKKADRMERSGEEFFLRVISGYDELAKREHHRIKVIDASGSINDTHKQILSHIKQKTHKI